MSIVLAIIVGCFFAGIIFYPLYKEREIKRKVMRTARKLSGLN